MFITGVKVVFGLFIDQCIGQNKFKSVVSLEFVFHNFSQKD